MKLPPALASAVAVSAAAVSAAADRVRGLTRLCLLGVVIGCATVTREDPPSKLDPGGSRGGGAGVTANAGTGGRAQGAAGNPSVGGAPAGNGGNPGAGFGGSSRAGAGGAAGRGGSTPTADAAPQFPPGTVLLQDDFEAFDSAVWFTTPESAWALTTDPELGSNVYGQTETASNDRHLASAGEVSWTNVIVQADVKVIAFNGSSTSYMAGVCVRVADADNFYLIGIRSNDRKIGLRNFTDGGSNLTESDFEETVNGVWYTLRVEVQGPSITAYLDGQLMFTTSDSTHPNGGIGLCTVKASAVFDNVIVTAP